MANYRRKNTKRRRKQQEATIVSDLFRILLAVSMLIVAILVAFMVMRNLSDFSLPDLRQTLQAETEAPVTVRVQETTRAAVETTIAPTTAPITVVETEEETEEEVTESETEEEVILDTREPYEIIQESTYETIISTEAPTLSVQESVSQVAPETVARYESPVIAGLSETESPGPGFEIEIDSNGPVGPGQ